jgi:hypothetical protein
VALRGGVTVRMTETTIDFKKRADRPLVRVARVGGK